MGCNGECWLMASVDSFTNGSAEIASADIVGVGGGAGTTVEVGAVPASRPEPGAPPGGVAAVPVELSGGGAAGWATGGGLPPHATVPVTARAAANVRR